MRQIIFVLLAGIIFWGCQKNDDGTVTVVPLPPIDLTASVISTTQVNLSWTDKSTNEDGFKIQRKTGSGNFTDVGTVGKDVTNYSDNGLTPATTYTYRVYAYNNVGNSLIYTNEVTVTTKQEVPTGLNNGLVGYWPFNGNANDESGNGNNGTVIGATLTSDRFGGANKAYSFDGKSLIKIIKNNILEPQNELSLVCWINPNYSQNQGSDASNSATQIIRKGAAFDNGYHLNWSNLDNRKIESRYYASWGNIVHGPPNETYKNSWNCVVMTYSKLTNESKLYINGMTVSSAPCSNILEHSDDMYIGGFKDFQFFNGKIDDIRIYNRALTQQEITYLANN